MNSLAIALLAILAVAVVLGFVIAKVEGLALLAPKSTKGVLRPAEVFCTERCRTPEGDCPLTGKAEQAADCPLWRFIGDDVPTQLHGSPFGHLQGA